MQTIRWVGFGPFEPGMETAVHLCPAARGVASCYQVHCRISMFGSSMAQKTVALEGARLGIPSAIRLNDFVRGAGGIDRGLLGFVLEVSSGVSNSDLAPSSCVVEVRSSSGTSLKYHPVLLSTLNVSRSAQVLPYPSDDRSLISLVLINSSPVGSDLCIVGSEKIVESMPPEGLIEKPILPRLNQRESRMHRLVSLPFGAPPGSAVYALLRSRQSQIPVGVCTLV